MGYLNEKLSVGEIKRVHGGNIHEFLRGNNLSQRKVIDFSANINPLGLSEKIKKVIIENIDTIIYYPDPYAQSLKKSLAQFHNIEEDNLLIGNGSIELIYLIPQALGIQKGLIITPSFSEYEFALRVKGAKPLFLNVLNEDDFALDFSKLESHLKKVEIVFLCNPNNPTGFILPPKEIRLFLELCAKYKVFMVVDEAFMDFIPEQEDFSLLTEAVNPVRELRSLTVSADGGIIPPSASIGDDRRLKSAAFSNGVKRKNLLVLRSMTKFFAFAGLRIGYVIGQKNLIEKISLFQYPWSVNCLAQIAAQAVVNDKDYIQKSREYILKEKDYLFECFRDIAGIKVYPPSANFILCQLTGNVVDNAKILSEKLDRQGIIIRDCSDFRGLSSKFFRVAVRRREENNQLIRAVRNILL